MLTIKLQILLGKTEILQKYSVRCQVHSRCASDTVIGIRSSSKTWFDLLIINGKRSTSMTLALCSIKTLLKFLFYILLEKKVSNQLLKTR